ncbi:MAG: hypothetical protein ACKPJJ_16400, partial [Planctomycetaceae bacterium]
AGTWQVLQSLLVSTVLMILFSAGLLLYSNTLVKNVEKLETSGLLGAALEMQSVRLIVRPLLERQQRYAMATGDDQLASNALLMRLVLGSGPLTEQELQLLENAVKNCGPADLEHLIALVRPAGGDLVARLAAVFDSDAN